MRGCLETAVVIKHVRWNLFLGDPVIGFDSETVGASSSSYLCSTERCHSTKCTSRRKFLRDRKNSWNVYEYWKVVYCSYIYRPFIHEYLPIECVFLFVPTNLTHSCLVDFRRIDF